MDGLHAASHTRHAANHTKYENILLPNEGCKIVTKFYNPLQKFLATKTSQKLREVEWRSFKNILKYLEI
jgi:hypothetical protein